MTDAWSKPLSPSDAARRAGGRTRYNAQRGDMAMLRRIEVVRLLLAYGLGRGVRARIAKELNVHPSTITRDCQALFTADRRPCPTCGTVIDDKKWARIARRSA